MKCRMLIISSLAVAAALSGPAIAQQDAPSEAERQAIRFERAKAAAAQAQIEKDAVSAAASRSGSRQKATAHNKLHAEASGQSHAPVLQFQKQKLRGFEQTPGRPERSAP